MTEETKKHAGGRPPKYTLEELKQLVEDFWRYCESMKKVPTKELLVSYLKITRETYNAWKGEGHEFSDTLKEQEAHIEADITHLLLTDSNPAGKIFYLKNAFGWRDRTETDVTSGGKPIPILGGITKKNE